jgi:hypothetical protein
MDWGIIKEKYSTYKQTESVLTDTKNLFGEFGRGSGKTTHMFASRVVRISYDMPRSLMMLTGPTYTFLLGTIVPEIITYLNKHYKRGIHFEYGKKPPKHFTKPDDEVISWNHTISFAWGTVIVFGSIDRPESFVGKNIVHLFVDEMLRIKEQQFRERAIPALRADKTLYGNSHYFKGITGFSSTPNMENDEDWFLEYKKNVNAEKIKEIKYVAFRIAIAGGKIVKLQEDIDLLLKSGKTSKALTKQKEVEKLNRFIKRWHTKLKSKLKEKEYWWNYISGTSFTNLAVLGLDYMEQQLLSTGDNWDKFNLSILCIRPNSVKNKFFSKFSIKHIFTDSYKYHGYTSDYRGEITNIDDFSIANGYKKSSLDLLYCDPDQALLVGYDPGYFMSAVVSQKKFYSGQEQLRIFKNFFKITPEQHHELAEEFDSFFKYHRRKVIYLYPDRAGHQKSPRHKDNPKGKTDVAILKKELEDLGWIVHVEGITRTIEYWEHFFLWDKLLAERDNRLPKLRFCQYECEEGISSIQNSPVKKRKDGSIELDKSSEVKLPYKDQAFWSTQIATAAMYLVFGLYHALKPEADSGTVDIPGL